MPGKQDDLNYKPAKKSPSKTGELVKNIFGILLIPIAIGVSIAFYREFGAINSPWTTVQQYLIMGIVSYCFVHLLFFKPSYLYVLGHESVHAISTWICMGTVKSFNVSSNGGSVTTSKTNAFISLSPYFVPFYSILAAFLFYILNNTILEEPIPYSNFVFLLGVTLAFHIVMTIDTLKTKQPDLIKTGYLPSIILIYVINVVLICGILNFLTSSFSFSGFLGNAFNVTIEIYQKIFTQLFLAR